MSVKSNPLKSSVEVLHEANWNKATNRTVESTETTGLDMVESTHGALKNMKPRSFAEQETSAVPIQPTVTSAKSDVNINQHYKETPMLDSEYLKEHLGDVLTLALCDIAIQRPVDPIYYLAHWLFKWRLNQYHDIQKKKELKELFEERKKRAEEMREQARKKEMEERKEESKAIADEVVEEVVERAEVHVGIRDDAKESTKVLEKESEDEMSEEHLSETEEGAENEDIQE